MSQLEKYIIALSNLYGMVHKDKVIEIYNSQNKNQITEEDVDKLYHNPTEELSDAFVLIHKDYFVIEAILENNEFSSMLRSKANKPFYIPEKEELLEYVDEYYFEKTKEYKALLTYLEKNFFKPGDIKAEELAEDIQGLCQFGLSFQGIMDEFNRRKISFKDMNQTNEVVKLVMNLSNNTRIWENNGHTPNEIHDQYEKPNLRPIPDQPIVFGRSDTTQMKQEKKIGRNDPCPCGSGKKYKNCCLGKE